MLYPLRRIITSVPLISVAFVFIVGIVVGSHVPPISVNLGTQAQTR